MKLILKVYCPVVLEDKSLSIDYCLNKCQQYCEIPYFLRRLMIEEHTKKIYRHIFQVTTLISLCPYQLKYMFENKIDYIEILKKPIISIGTLIHKAFDELIQKYESNSITELKLSKKYQINNRKLLLVGRCDYLQLNEDDTFSLIDWKFTNVKDKTTFTIRPEYVMQLNIYKNLIQDKLNKKPSELSIYVISNSGIGKFPVPIYDYDYIENFIIKKLKEFDDVLSNKDIKITDENKCKFCPYLINKNCVYKIADSIIYHKILNL